MQYEESIDLVRQRSGVSYSDDVKTVAFTVLGEYLNRHEKLTEILCRSRRTVA